MKIQYFTDITTNASNFCLLNIKKYFDRRKDNKKMILVDPSVYELTKSSEYSNIELLHKLASNEIPLQSNEYLSIDYPCDMNLKYSEEFIEKTYQNNIKYANNLQYICTPQTKFKDYFSFFHEMERTKHIWSQTGKVLGIGNLCRLFNWSKTSDTKAYLDLVFSYLKLNIDLIDRIHFYGIGLKMIREYIPILNKIDLQITIDSTKWTKAVNTKLKLSNGVCCRKNTRDLYFTEYMKTIQEIGFEIEY